MNNIFVFDTNCLISTHLLPHSVSRKAFNKGLETGILVYSESTISEFLQTFVQPKFDRCAHVEQRLNAIAAFEIAQLINVTITINDCRDPKDNKFLKLAI